MTATSMTIHTEAFPEIHYRKAGTGKPLFLIHGFPEDSSLWEKVLPGIQETYTVIMPDLPGAGKSRAAAATLTMETMAGMLLAIQDHESSGPMVLGGHSMGGYTALAFASLYPDRVCGLSLIHSSAYADSPEKKESREKSIQILKKGGQQVFLQGMIPALFSEKFRQSHPETLKAQLKRAEKITPESMIRFYEAMIGRKDHRRFLQETSLPVQWIIGKEDSLIPLSDALTQTHLPSVSFVSIYENTGHMSMIEDPEKLSADLAAFTRYCYYP